MAVDRDTPELEIWQEEAPGGYPSPELLALDGIGRMRAWRAGQLPTAPIGYLTESRLDEVAEGTSTFSIAASPWFASATGLIPGGWLAVVADAAFGGALGGVLAAGQWFTTAELSLNFLRPVRPDPEARISAGGQLIHRGGTVGLTECFLINELTDELVAFGSSRLAIFPPNADLPAAPEDLPIVEEVRPGDSPDHPLRRPVRGAPLPPEVFEERSGLEILRGFIAGELEEPPLTRLTGLRAIEAREGEVAMALPCSRWLSTQAGTVQGGFTVMVAEAALAASVFSTAEAGTATAPLDLKVNFLRPVFPDGEDLVARARIVHRGRTLAVATCEVTNSAGKTVALATGSAMYLPGRPADLTGVELAPVAGAEE